MPLALKTYPTLAEAGSALKDAGARYIGGGTLVVRAANEGDVSLSTFVRSTDPALSAIKVEGGRATIGASVTMSAIARHPGLSAIAKAAKAVGGPAIRNMATVGGNLFAPAPYGDFAVALLALDATVHTTSGDLGIEEFLAGREGSHAVVASVSFAVPSAEKFRFAKVSRVKPKGVSVLSIAAVIDSDARQGEEREDRARLHGRSSDPRQGRREGARRCNAYGGGRCTGGGRGRGGDETDHRRDSQRLVSQRGSTGAFPPAASGGVAATTFAGVTPQGGKMAKVPVQFTLNGEEKAEFVDSGATLIKVLRDKLGDTSPKGGCHQGTCGACSVMIDGELKLSCLTLAETCKGADILTNGGLARDGVLHPLQRAFMDEFAAQCGFCTSGMIMAAKALLDRTPNPSREDVVDALSGNICRCTGYEPIIRAVLTAARSNSQNAA